MIVFISYQRSDTLFAAHAVGYAIRGGGHKVFVDTGSIGGGEIFPEVISNAIAESNVMLALVGPNFDFSRLQEENNVVAFEWRRALFHGIAVIPVLVDGGVMSSDNDLPVKLRWFAKRNAYFLHRVSLSSDIQLLINDLPLLRKMPRRSARVLWVDDRPANNEFERKALRPYGIVFDNVVSTDEAIAQLINESYDLIITDFSRVYSSERSRVAGTSLLEHPAVVKGSSPVIVYAGNWVMRQRNKLLQLGASEVTADRQQLISSVVELLGRNLDTHITE